MAEYLPSLAVVGTEYLPIVIVAGVLVLGGAAIAWIKNATSHKDKV
jgi:hypothetical protein